MAKKITYAEPVDYIPETVRKKLGLGEYNAEANTGASEKSNTKAPAKSTPKKNK